MALPGMKVTWSPSELRVVVTKMVGPTSDFFWSMHRVRQQLLRECLWRRAGHHTLRGAPIFWRIRQHLSPITAEEQ